MFKIQSMLLVCHILCLGCLQAMETSSSQGQVSTPSRPLVQQQNNKITLLNSVAELENIVRPGDWVILDIDETILKLAGQKTDPESILLNLDPKIARLVDNWRKSYPAS